MTIEEEDAFLLTFDTLMDELSSLPTYSDMEETIDWLRRAVFYNVPGGKQIRGRGVIAAYKALVEDPTEAAVQDCYVLGWCIEIVRISCKENANQRFSNSNSTPVPSKLPHC